MKNWVVSAKKADFNEIAKKYNITPMLARIMRNRDIIGDDAINMYLNGDIKDMYSPLLLKDMNRAVGLVADAIRNNRKIMIIGDYDIDGVCSSYILRRGIEALKGAVDVILPDRVLDGYGMNMSMIDRAYNEGFEIIVTCDNGIAAYNEVEYAKSKGMTVVITDHHEVPFEEIDGNKEYRLPPADAVVDPKQEDCSYPFRDVCGGVVAFKFIQALFDEMKDCPCANEILNELLMFAGFATVGDVMELKDENRVIVKHAISCMKDTSHIGMNALIDVTGIDRANMSPYYIGFILGPCINATGRLDTANRAIDLFMSSSYEEALNIATELKSLNDSRKDLTVLYTEEAIKLIESDEGFVKEKVLVVYLPECHESLAGIIAGRLREKYYKPVFVLTRAEDMVKGSGRSIENYNMYEEMNKCCDLFTKFGGHKMAAGLSLEEANIEEFRRRINEECSLTKEDMVEKIVIDIPMPIEYASMNFAKELSYLEPYGNGNSKPLFAQKDVRATNIKVIGKNKNAVKMTIKSANGGSVPAICFGDGIEIERDLAGRQSFSILYELGINEYMGNESVQLVIKDWKY